MHKLLELGALNELPSGIVSLLFVERVELLKDVLADVAVLLLDLGGDLVGVARWDLLTTLLHHLQSEVSDVSTGERNVLHTR